MKCYNCGMDAHGLASKNFDDRLKPAMIAMCRVCLKEAIEKKIEEVNKK